MYLCDIETARTQK